MSREPRQALAEYLVGLLSDSNECGSATEFLQFLGPNVCARGPETPEDILDGVVHIPPVLHLHCLALRSSGKEGERVHDKYSRGLN